jgi:NAD(P)-dependent dehydrogenase (short-subunit alcohol dehydrogenase family)
MWLMSRLFAPAGERGKLNLKFENKTALVSASTAGIGFAIALELAREGGAWVFVNGRTQARVQAAIVNIRHEIYESQVEGIAEDLAALASAENLLHVCRRNSAM